ncbi:DUF2948 family protein [Rhodovibrionaceae bacterium A322]
MAEQRPVKLRAKDLGDMDVVASCLQDAIIPSTEMTFLESDNRFVMVANRFMWEKSPEKMEQLGDEEGDAADASFEDVQAKEAYFRVNCAITVDKVKKVLRKGFAPGGSALMLNLLTIATEKNRITFYFSNNSALRLETGGISVHTEDLGEPWPTWSRPDHFTDDAEATGEASSD